MFPYSATRVAVAVGARKILRLRVAAAVAIALLSFGSGVAAKSIALDASWWGTLTADGRVAAVAASTDAYDAGWARGYTDASARGRSQVPKFSHTFGYYVAAISDFYETHDHVRGVSIGPIMGCLSDKPITSCGTLARGMTSGE